AITDERRIVEAPRLWPGPPEYPLRDALHLLAHEDAHAGRRTEPPQSGTAGFADTEKAEDEKEQDGCEHQRIRHTGKRRGDFTGVRRERVLMDVSRQAKIDPSVRYERGKDDDTE